MLNKNSINILVSQPAPASGKSPFYDLRDKYSLRVDFRKFIQVDPISGKEFRKNRVDLKAHNAVILNSKTAIDHYFRVCQELNIDVSPDTKYFCVSESVGVYLQKYIQLRKRKVHYGKGNSLSLVPLVEKYKTEKFIMPCSDVNKGMLKDMLAQKNIPVTEAVLYKTVASDLSDLTSIKYDIIVFYSPIGIKSLFDNFPDFIQEDRQIAVFGRQTEQACKQAGLVPNIKAPAPGLPSMTMAIEAYIKSL